jgi:hypothetical protein
MTPTRPVAPIALLPAGGVLRASFDRVLAFEAREIEHATRIERLGHEVVDGLQDPPKPGVRVSLVAACPEAMPKRDVVGPLPVPGDYVGVASLQLVPRHLKAP